MYINSIGYYLPELVVPNSYFRKVNGLTAEWIFSRTGIIERRKADKEENTNTMAIEAVKHALPDNPFSIQDVDLIIGSTYSPYDTVVTVAHEIQHNFNISGVKVVSVSAACSSFINSVEIVEGYFASNKAEFALIVASEHNTAYSNESDESSGHLWGDGAAAVFISKKRLSENDLKILDVTTEGLGNIGNPNESVFLHPSNGGIKMPNGRDVFINANKFMSKALIDILMKNSMSINDVKYVIPHQANARIIENVRSQLKIGKEKMIINIDKLGNTGSASTPIALAQIKKKIKHKDVIGITVFGGGYSSGAMLIKK